MNPIPKTPESIGQLEAVAHAPAKTARTSESSGTGTKALCAECLAPLRAAQPGTLFCCPAHRKSFQTRQRQRGRQIYPYVVAARLTRGGTRGDEATRDIGKNARAVMQRLIARHAAEDKAKKRMSMIDYVARLSKRHDLPL